MASSANLIARSGEKDGPLILFIGAERVGLACLKQLLDLEKNVTCVITADGSHKERIADFVPFDDLAAQHDLPLFKVRSTKSPESIELVRQKRPDLIVVVSWSQIVPEEILEVPRLGCIGLHYAKLPERRGGAPLNWAILDRLQSTSLTLFFMDSGIDSGDIIGSREIEIQSEDTARDLLDKVMEVAPILLKDHIDQIEKGAAPRTRQNEEEAGFFPRRFPADSELDFDQPLDRVHDLIRAVSPPFPPAFVEIGTKRLAITRARRVDQRLLIEGYLEETSE